MVILFKLRLYLLFQTIPEIQSIQLQLQLQILFECILRSIKSNQYAGNIQKELISNNISILTKSGRKLW